MLFYFVKKFHISFEISLGILPETGEVALEVFLGKGALKICSKFAGEHPCQGAMSIIAFWHGCSHVNLLHIFRTPFPKNTCGRLPQTISFLIIFLCSNDE